MRAKVLKLLAKEGELSAKEIAIKLSISLSETYRLLRDLIRMKILERRKRKYAIKEPLSDILRYIIGKYKLEAIIKKRNLRILVCLINPATIVQIKECSSLSEKTLKEALNELLMRGIIKKIDDKFEIIDDPILRMFAFIMKNIILGLEKYAFIVYFGNTFIIKAVEKGKKAKGTKTAFSIFKDFSIDIQIPYDYYVYPPMEVGIEEAIIHSLLICNDRYERTLVALLYLKNYEKINHHKLIDLAIKNGVLREIKELDNYVSGRYSHLFLPYDEFVRLAGQYDINPFKLFEKKFSRDMLEKIALNIEKEITVLLIGGGAMVLKGYKVATADIDLIIRNQEDLQEIERALSKLNYSLKAADLALIYSNDGPDIDIYVKTIPGKFVLHDKVFEYAELLQLGKLRLYIASDTHIFYMKAVSGRPKDIDDLITLVRKGRIDWKLLTEEIERQDELLEQPMSPRILKIIEELERILRIRIPMKRKIKSIAIRNYTKYLLKRGIKDPKRLARELGISEDLARRKIKEVEDEMI